MFIKWLVGGEVHAQYWYSGGMWWYVVVSGGSIMVAIVDVGASYELEPLICAK